MDSGEEGNYLLLTRDCLDVGAINALATAGSCGAISLFVGTTRDNFDGKKVLSLEYEAYEPMALKEMQAICEELRRRWSDIAKIVIYHRVGLVPVGEASVVIAISSPHRVTSLEAVAVAIEDLKKRVPIWKKEKYEGDESAWKENKESDFDERCCSIQDNDSTVLPPQFIQISATEMEINRRIQCFVEKKREEIDLNNIIDYARPPMDQTVANGNNEVLGNENNTNNTPEEAVTCARTNSTIIKQESSKGHLKVSQTENYIGPQVRHSSVNITGNTPIATRDVKPFPNLNDFNQNNPLRSDRIIPAATQAVLDRIANIEEHLNMSDDTKKDVNKRLKALEERLLHLESLSPEYRHFLFDKSQDSNSKSYPFLEHPSTESKQHIQHLTCNNTKVYNIGDINAIIEDMS